MAVYPNKIVLKDTTELTATAVAQIGDGTEDIVFGEIVVNRVSGEVFLLTKVDATTGRVISAPAPLGNRGDITVTNNGYGWTINDGAITDAKIAGPLSIGKGGTGAGTATTAINNLLPAQSGNNGKILTTNGSSISWGILSIGSLSDVDTLTTSPSSGDALIWDSLASKWVPGLGIKFINDLLDVDTDSKPLVTGQTLVYDGTNWINSAGATEVGRGDGGDFDITEVLSSFVFGVWGGGDFDSSPGIEDPPIELVTQDIVDGCEIISDFTAVSINSAGSISIEGADPGVAIGYSAVLSSPASIALTANDPFYTGLRAWIDIDAKNISLTSSDPIILIIASEGTDYYGSYTEQIYGYKEDIYPDWWAD